MSRSRNAYDNAYNRNRTRIDTRPQGDPAVAAGMRNIHRGMDGQVIGGITAEGNAIGTKASKYRGGGGSINPRPNFAPQVVEMKKPAASKYRNESVLAPKTNPPPVSRQQFYANQQAARVKSLNPSTPPSKPVVAAPAKSTVPTLAAAPKPAMTVAASAPKPAVSTAAPATKPTLQIATSTPGARNSNINRLTGKPMGWRPGDDATPKLASKPTPMGPPAPPPRTGPPSPPPAMGPPKPQDSALATSFAVKPVANPQAIGETPVKAKDSPASRAASVPGGDFEALTQPKPAAASAPAVAQPQAATATSKFRTPVGGPSFTTPEAIQSRKDAEVEDYQKSKKKAYDKVWNAQPNLPIADPNSMANKAYKSVRAFASGASY